MGRDISALMETITRRRAPAPGLLFLLILCVFRSASQAADWPMFRGNPERTGYTAEQAAPPLTQEWEFTVPVGIVSSPAVYDGKVYVGSRANKLYALDAVTGVKLWERLTAGWVDSSPYVSSTTVYAACLGGRLYAMDRLTGALRWIVDLGAASASSPLLLNGKVYIGTGSPENKLKVYNAETGALLAAFQAAQPVDSAPSTDGTYVYFGANDGQIYALDAVTLTPRWNAYPTIGSFGMNAVAVSSGSLYALPGRDEKRAVRLSLADWSQLAVSAALTSAGPWTQAGSPVADGKKVYYSAVASDGLETGTDLASLSPDTLAAVWSSSRPLDGVSPVGVLSSPAMANEVIYAATPGGKLIVVSSAGVQLAELDLSSPAYSSPAISNGMVIAANYGGKITGYRAGRHAAISRPASGDILNGMVTVKGYFANPALSGYELEYSTGGVLPQWVRISSAALTSAAADAELAVWDVSGLQNGLYTLRLRVLESSPSGYEGSASARVRINAAPLPPSGLSAADVPGDGGNAIALSWTASPLAGVSSYQIYRDDGSSPALSLLASTTSISYIDATAVTGTTFTYVVTAWDGWVESVRSEEVYSFSVNNTGDETPPAAITDLAAVTGFVGGDVHLVWTAPGDDGDIGAASHYLIRYSTDPEQAWGAFASLAGSSRPVDGPAGIIESDEAFGLLAGVTYYFAIKAVDDAGNEAAISNIASAWSAYDTVPPKAPFGLSVADAPGDEGGRLILLWNLSPDDGGGAGDVYGYKVYRRAPGASYVSSSPYTSLTAGSSSYMDPAATVNVRYYYSVAAFDSTNNSVLSGEASGVSADNWRFFDSSRGGEVRLADGTQVTVPAGAASQNDKIMIYRLDALNNQPIFRMSAAAPAKPTGIVYEIRFQNAATRLLAPAVITLPYTDPETAGMNAENLRLYTLSSGAWVLVDTSRPDPAAKKVSAEVSHFSIYSIMEYVPSGELLDKSEVYTYPNPAKGVVLTFKFKPAYKADVKIDVYSIAGEKVAKFEKENCPAGLTSEIVWGIENIASGVYQYRVEAVSAAGTKSVIKRLAVIH